MALVTKTFSDIITFTRASTATYFDSAGVLTSAGNNVPRFDYNPATLAARGLLIEEQRTNSIRNNTMQGASAGVAPTNWTANGATGNGITLTVVGVGTENGIAYVDYEINGTATITGTATSIVFDTPTVIAASATQIWAWSSYLKLVAGTLTDLTFTPRISWRDSGGGALSSNDGTSVPTSAGLATQRPSFSATAPASTGYVQPQLRIGTVNGSTYTGVRIRIGLPQLEQGAFATSVIPTTNALALGVTRSADVASVNTLSPWFNASAGTIVCQGLTPPGAASFPSVGPGFSDGTASNRIIQYLFTNGFYGAATTGGSSQGNTNITTTPTVGAQYKFATAYANNDSQSALNGTASSVDTTYTVPAVNQMQINTAGANNNYPNSWIQRITYYPRRLSQAELVSVTA